MKKNRENLPEQPDKDEYLDIIIKVRTLIEESYKQMDLMTPEYFCKLWVKHKNDLHLDSFTMDNPKAMTSFYQHYMFLRLLEKNIDKKAEIEKESALHFARNIPLIETMWKEQEKARKINAKYN